MQTNGENANGPSGEPGQVDETVGAAAPLLALLALMKQERFEPTIPDAATAKLLQVAGCVTSDPKATKLISLAAQTFVSVVAKDALQHYKMRGAPQSNRFKGKDGKDEPHNTLLMEDLISSIEDHGVIVKKPPYFV